MFSVKCPTPTTVLYKVSTRSASKTLAVRALSYGFLLARILACMLVLALLLVEYRLSFPTATNRNGILASLEEVVFASVLGKVLSVMAIYSSQL